MTHFHRRKALLLGGAGFIGSMIARKLLSCGYEVMVIDALLPGTGGSLTNIGDIQGDIKFINDDIGNIKDLHKILFDKDLVIDAMGWTSHLDGLANPIRDLELNQLNHLKIVENLAKNQITKIIYLGSRSQYGIPQGNSINELSPCNPTDAQGIHKLAAESYFRIYSERNNWKVISLRLPNVFGEGQKTQGNDIGLVGGMIKSSLANEDISVYKGSRKRNVLYVSDLADMIIKIDEVEWPLNFQILNIPGKVVQISDLAKTIVVLTQSGTITYKDLPQDIAAIDFNVEFLSDFLANFIRENYTDIELSLLNTINYFKRVQYEC